LMTESVEKKNPNSYFFSFFFDVSSMGHSWGLTLRKKRLCDCFKSTRQQIFWSTIQTFPTFVFDYRSGQTGSANQKVWICQMNT
jgi:hypothetical protein